VPYDAGFILVRDGELQRRTFASEEAYLRRSQTGLAGGDWWPCDYGPDLSRSFRALKTWFTLKTYGTQALGASIQRTCDLAAELGARIAAEPELELLAPVQLNIVCFRHRGAEADALNEAIVARLHAEGAAAPSLTRIDGKTAIRAAIVNHRTDRRDIATLVDQVLVIGRELVGEQAA
jgi:aromatic-L-amino-acid decarboxylase